MLRTRSFRGLGGLRTGLLRGARLTRGLSSHTGDDDATPEKEPSALTRISVGEDAPRPANLLAIPIQRRPIYPGFISPLIIHDRGLIEALAALKKTPSPFVGVFLLRDPKINLDADQFSLTSTDQIYGVGTMAHIQQLDVGPNGVVAMLMAHRRVKILDVVATPRSSPLAVRVQHLSPPPLEAANSDHVKAMSNEIIATLRDLMAHNPVLSQHMAFFAKRIDVSNPFSLADFVASITMADAADLQDVLETMDLNERLNKALILLKKELQLSLLQQTIKQDVEKRMDKAQKQYFLMEQLKVIKKELGMEKDDKDALLTKFRERVAGLQLPATAQAVLEEELEKLAVLERNSSEFNVTRTYLDWLTSIPWGKFSVDNFDIAAAKKILDEDHYGMSDVKDRILEFIAVGRLKGSVHGKIVCLVGPPGVGKTSIGKSIARALNRQFFRFSVGGLNDVAEIKGHRRTYVGAMPGKLIQCMKSTGVSNPLVLIDEIDKIGHGRGYNGDPSSALLEMLDPNQNATFADHYLDTPVDASKVLFICTANTLDTIPGPLLDRMEVIRLSGYDQPEKMEITKRYLDPKIRVETGLEASHATTPKSLQLEDSAIEHLIRWYAREAGVRSLEKLIGKIFRKAAIKIVSAREAMKQELIAKGEWPAAAAAAAPAEGVPAGTAAGTPSAAAAAAAAAAASADLHAPDAGGAASPAPPAAAPEVNDAAAGAAPAAPAAPAVVAVEPPIDVEDPSWTVTASNLADYVGKPPFSSDRLYASTPPGVVMGLAWTNMGGSALYIEVVSPYAPTAAAAAPSLGRSSGAAQAVASARPLGAAAELSLSAGSRRSLQNDPPRPTSVDDEDEGAAGGVRATRVLEADAAKARPSGGSLKLTGKMGEVMQESAQIAYTVARRALRAAPGHAGNDFLDTMPLHMHVPEGATPKDGPSAGVTMVTALLSVAMARPARADLAMTGEVTLTGKVLPVGGIREKVMAARRALITCVVLPAANQKDWEELPDHLKEGIEAHFAAEYADVFAVAFPSLPDPPAA